MAKIATDQKRTLNVRNDDLKLVRKRNPDFSADAVDAHATLLAAARNAHVVAGGRAEAAMAAIRVLPRPMQKRIGRELLKAA